MGALIADAPIVQTVRHIAQIRHLLTLIPHRSRVALAAQVLLADADRCDRQLSVLLRALARDEVQHGMTTGNTELAADPWALKLSPRRRETLQYLMFGLSEKEVAHRMNLTRDTVHEHVKAIYRTLRVHSRAELMAAAHARCETRASSHNHVSFSPLT